MSSVVIDNEAGTRAGMQHLYSLGHRRFAFIRGPKQVVDSNRRWQGIGEFAREAGVDLNSKLVVELKQPASSYEAGFEAMQALLNRQMPFTALMTFDDITAFGAIRALSQAGRKVPQECAVIGFDDVAMSAFYNPPLTTIRQPMDTLGAASVEILTEAINASLDQKAYKPVHRKIKPQLVVRESTTTAAAQ